MSSRSKRLANQYGRAHLLSGPTRTANAGRLAIAKRKIAGSLRLENLDPQAISVFVPALQGVRGQISAAFEVQGTVADPQLGGEMSWQKGEVVVIQEQQDRHSGAAPKTAPAEGAVKVKANTNTNDNDSGKRNGNGNGNANGSANATPVVNAVRTTGQRPNRPQFSARASGPRVNRR